MGRRDAGRNTVAERESQEVMSKKNFVAAMSFKPSFRAVKTYNSEHNEFFGCACLYCAALLGGKRRIMYDAMFTHR